MSEWILIRKKEGGEGGREEEKENREGWVKDEWGEWRGKRGINECIRKIGGASQTLAKRLMEALLIWEDHPEEISPEVDLKNWLGSISEKTRVLLSRRWGRTVGRHGSGHREACSYGGLYMIEDTRAFNRFPERQETWVRQLKGSPSVRLALWSMERKSLSPHKHSRKLLCPGSTLVLSGYLASHLQCYQIYQPRIMG